MNAITLNDYRKGAARSAGAGGDGERRLMIAALGMAGEAGEFANKVKQRIAHGHPIPNEDLADELGDVLWYLAEAATALGIDLGQIGADNLDKLKKRYPEGFSEERSVNRNE